MPQNFHNPSPPSDVFRLSYPASHVLLVTIDLEKSMNALPLRSHWQGELLFRWFDAEPSLRVAIITGAGKRAFCAGQDLIEQDSISGQKTHPRDREFAPGGFAGLSRRKGKKPVIAAVNGYALGGGFEICLNSDLVIAAPQALFGLPETSVGVYAAAGGLPRLVRTCGMQVASEVALAGRKLTAQEARQFNLVNKISSSAESLIEEAIVLANAVARQSPDAVIVSRHGLRETWETASVERAVQLTSEIFEDPLIATENRSIGLRSFKEKKIPQWVDPKL